MRKVTIPELAEALASVARHRPMGGAEGAMHPEDACYQLEALLEGLVGALASMAEDAPLPACSADNPHCGSHRAS